MGGWPTGQGVGQTGPGPPEGLAWPVSYVQDLHHAGPGAPQPPQMLGRAISRVAPSERRTIRIRRTKHEPARARAGGHCEPPACGCSEQLRSGCGPEREADTAFGIRTIPAADMMKAHASFAMRLINETDMRKDYQRS